MLRRRLLRLSLLQVSLLGIAALAGIGFLLWRLSLPPPPVPLLPPKPSPLAVWPWPAAVQDAPHPGVTHWRDTAKSLPPGMACSSIVTRFQAARPIPSQPMWAVMSRLLS